MKKERFQNYLELAGIFIIVAVLLIIGRIVTPVFWTKGNFMAILNGVAILGIVAAGMGFITYSGNLADLSLPSIMAFSGIITVETLHLGLPIALVLGVLAGMCIGAMNGLIVGKLKANPILWTLAVAFFMEGVMRFIWSGNQVYPATTPGSSGAAFIQIFRTTVLDVPLVILVMFSFFVFGQWVMSYTKFGKESKLVGSSRNAAETSGIHVPVLMFCVYVFAAFAAAVGGVFVTSLNKLGVFDLGIGYDFQAVTAVVIGGVMLSGGRGNMFGVLGGVLVIGLLTNIMNFMGITSFRQNVVTGLVFILIVGLQQYQLRRKGKDYA